MIAQIDDRAVDSLHIAWEQSPAYTGPRVSEAPPELRMIRDFLSRETWQHFVQFILPGVLGRHGRVAEYSGFRFPSDLDPDEDEFEGVEMFDPIDTIYISERAFDRLMSRYLDAIVQGVTLHQGSDLQAAWWQSLVVNAQILKTRAI